MSPAAKELCRFGFRYLMVRSPVALARR